MTNRVKESRESLNSLPSETLEQLCKCLIVFLGKATTENEEQALAALKKREYDSAKLLCLKDPCNPYLAAISCIASAYRSPMVADSVLRDAARHVSEVAKVRTANEIGLCFSNILSQI